jgi:antitoxin (DNA-binding transcriptional repressor) of toxin-antitoxin stability system
MTYSIDIERDRKLAGLVEQVLTGADVVLTRGDRPVARLVPLSASDTPRQFGSARGLIELAPDFDEPLEDFRHFRT